LKFLSIMCAAIGFAAMGISAAEAIPPQAGSIVPSFTADQARDGQNIYLANCSMCHGANLEGVYAPALAGPNGNVQWQSVSDVYAYTKAQMPVANAGGLSSRDYVDVTAYLLRMHGHHAGTRPLTTSAAATSTAFLGPQ
jgi:polar amino acid transport system substrate-binding protein